MSDRRPLSEKVALVIKNKLHRQNHRPQSLEKHSALKAKLSDLAHAYCGTPVNAGDFLMHRECLSAIKTLRSNSNILITKPDKGSCEVILNKTDYIKKK